MNQKTQFANIVKVSPSRITGYKYSQSISPKTITKICDYLKCSIDFITMLNNEFCYPNIFKYSLSNFFAPCKSCSK